MGFKFIVGCFQIFFSVVIIAGTIAGLTIVRFNVIESIRVLSPRIAPALQNQINLSMIQSITTGTSILLGLLGILFFLQGIVNLKKDMQVFNSKISTESNDNKVNTGENIPDEY